MKHSGNKTDRSQRALKGQRTNAAYRTVWRWHFYAGLFVAPFLLIFALSGIAMVVTTLVSGVNGEAIPIQAVPGQSELSLHSQEAIARHALPDGEVVELMVGAEEGQANLFALHDPELGTLMVALDPYRGVIKETWWQGERLYDVAKLIHSSLMIGVIGDLILETAAGFGILLIFSGWYLWWPRQRPLLACFIPRLHLRGRALWREAHIITGVYSSLLLLAFLLSGMSWTGVWGGQLVQAWNTFPTEKWSAVSSSQETHGERNHGGASAAPWTLEQASLPLSAPNSAAKNAAGETVDVVSVRRLAERQGINGRFRIKYPADSEGVWTLSQDTMNGDAQDPFSDRTIHIDQYSGTILADIRFNEYPIAGKVMAVSIPLHMGLLGKLNLAANLLVCVAAILLPITGLVLWWKRRATHTTLDHKTSIVVTQRPNFQAAKVALACLAIAFPMVGVTLVTLAAIDRIALQFTRKFRHGR